MKGKSPLFEAILSDLGLPGGHGKPIQFVPFDICPDDPSLPPEQRVDKPVGRAARSTSYQGNAFALVDNPSLTVNFPDGLSHTIGVAGQYVKCGKKQLGYIEFETDAYNQRRPTFAGGGPAFGGKNFADVYPVTENRVTRPGVTFVAGGRLWKYSRGGANDRDVPEPRPGDCDPQLPNTPASWWSCP